MVVFVITSLCCYCNVCYAVVTDDRFTRFMFIGLY